MVLGYTDSDCLFGIFKLFLNRDCHQVDNINKTITSHFNCFFNIVFFLRNHNFTEVEDRCVFRMNKLGKVLKLLWKILKPVKKLWILFLWEQIVWTLYIKITGSCYSIFIVLYVCFVDRCLSLCTFSFGHCVVCFHHIFATVPSQDLDFQPCQLKWEVIVLLILSTWWQSLFKKSLKIPKGQSESVYPKTDNTMAKRKSTKGQTTINKTYREGQTSPPLSITGLNLNWHLKLQQNLSFVT
jgi:hypothetical protein